MKRVEARDKNQDKKAMVADNWYLLQNFTGHLPFECSRRSTTLAVEQAAASVRNDSTYQKKKGKNG